MSYINKVALFFVLTFIPLSSPLAHELVGGRSGFLHAMTTPEHFINLVAVALMGAFAASLFGSKTYIYKVCGVAAMFVGLTHVGVMSVASCFFVGGFVVASVVITVGTVQVSTSIAKYCRTSNEQHK